MLPRPDPWGRLKAFWKRIHEAETRPHALAMGFSLGLFVALLPIVGQALLAAVVAVPLRANKAVAVGLTLLNNPFTMVPYLTFATWFGGLILPEEPADKGALKKLLQDFHWEHFLTVGTDLLYPMLVGSLTLGFGLSIPLYFLVRFITERRTTKTRSMPK